MLLSATLETGGGGGVGILELTLNLIEEETEPALEGDFCPPHSNLLHREFR